MRRWLLLVGAAAIHAGLSAYSFLALFGIAHMHPDDRPAAVVAAWQAVLLVTWFPLLLLLSDLRVGGERVIDSGWGLALLIVNSATVVACLWLGLRALSRRAGRRPPH